MRALWILSVLACWVWVVLGVPGRAAASGRPGEGGPSPAPLPPPLDQGHWRLTFQDEFDGDHLDLTKWNPEDPWGAIRNNELQGYVTDAFEVSNGVLRIRADRREVTYGGKRLPFTSGMMTTYQKFHQQYGYFEIRCRVPAGKGLWPAFWLLPVPLGWPPEIDVLENLGHEPTKMYFTNHWSEGGKHQAYGGSLSGPDFSREFHVIGVEWSPSELRWYVDGRLAWRSDRGLPHQAMYMLVNLAVGGNWPGAPAADTPFPSYFEVDYVRVYQRADWEQLPRLAWRGLEPGARVQGRLEVQLVGDLPAGVPVERLAVTLNSATLISGDRWPEPLVLDSRAYPDGPYTLTAQLRLANGMVAQAALPLHIDNWWETRDELQAPMTSIWFGTVDFSKTSARSEGWEYDTEHPAGFGGDASRLRWTGHQEAFLEWEAPHLREVRVTLYAPVREALGQVELSVSGDKRTWVALPYRVEAREGASGGWAELQLESTVPEAAAGGGQVAAWFRLTVRPPVGGAAASPIEVGEVWLRGQQGLDHSPPQQAPPGP